MSICSQAAPTFELHLDVPSNQHLSVAKALTGFARTADRPWRGRVAPRWHDQPWGPRQVFKKSDGQQIGEQSAFNWHAVCIS